MGPLIFAVASASLLGSLHCVGMCGGLLGACVGCQQVPAGTQVRYHIARGVVYLILGGVAGALGASLDLTGELASLQALAAWLAGGFLVSWGLWQWHSLWRARSSTASSSPSRWSKLLGLWLRKWPGKTPNARAWGLGLASALLPCGWLYGFVLVAAATASVTSGVVVMATFWLGTVPALAGFAIFVRKSLPGLQKRLPHLIPLVWITLGIVTIVERDQLDLQTIHASISQDLPTSSASDTEDGRWQGSLNQVRQLEEGGAPCCADPKEVAPKEVVPKEEEVLPRGGTR